MQGDRDCDLARGWNVTSLTARSHAVAGYYGITGYRPALDSALCVVNYHRRHGQVWSANGRFLLSHFHIQTIGLIGALETALVAEGDNRIALVKQGDEFASG